MSSKSGCKYEEEEEEEMELRRGPWTVEEDTLLIHYIACHGEGRWNLLARCSGLKRTGKSCRLRWLNYLKPDVKRGNLTPEEQILILELHSKWGNRWSRIAQHLPGRTDNEIKNYWRTRVQKQARQLKIDANSALFRDTVRCFWMPRLLEKMGSASLPPPPTTTTQSPNPNAATALSQSPPPPPPPFLPPPCLFYASVPNALDNSGSRYELSAAGSSENCSPCISSDSMAIPQLPKILSEFPPTTATTTPPDALGNHLLYSYNPHLNGQHHINNGYDVDGLDLVPASASSGVAVGCSDSDCSMMENNYVGNNADNLWSMDELWQVRNLHEWGI